VTFSGYSSIYFGLTSNRVYFGRKLISKGIYNAYGSGDYITLASVVADRLGSIGKFYPFGLERPSATGNDTEKFTGYFRDASTGLDYAQQRYHQPGVGRFMTPDPYWGSASLTNPGSWNRYAYVGGDPVNHKDPSGLDSNDCSGNFAQICAGSWDFAYVTDPTSDEEDGVPPDGVPPDGIDSVGNPVYQVSGSCGCPTGSDEMGSTAPAVISLINQDNPQGFINFSAAVIASTAVGTATVSVALDATLATATVAGTAVEGAALKTPSASVAAPAPSFLGQAQGPAIAVPQGSTGPVATVNNLGDMFIGGNGGNGLADGVNSVRIMDPNPLNPTGYVNYGSIQSDGGWQSVNPYTGSPISPNSPWWHIPLW